NRVKARQAHQILGAKNVDKSTPVLARPQKIFDIVLRLAEKIGCSLIVKNEQPPLDRSDGRRRYISVPRCYLSRAVTGILQQRPQIFEIDEEKPILIGELEDNVEDALLNIVQFKDSCEQERTHVRDSGADRMARLAKEVPKRNRKLVR